jgi:hypothetical protein
MNGWPTLAQSDNEKLNLLASAKKKWGYKYIQESATWL